MTCPLCSTGITPLHRYYGAVRPCPAHRYFRPRGCSACALYGLFVVKRFQSSDLFFLLSSSVSLFDLESRFFAPTHSIARPARAGAVKVGRRTDLSKCSALARPHLDSSEHGGTSQADGLGPKLSGCLQRPPFIALGAEPRHLAPRPRAPGATRRSEACAPRPRSWSCEYRARSRCGIETTAPRRCPSGT